MKDLKVKKGGNLKGSLTVEASVALVFFMMFMLAFLSICRYCTYQNKVKHCVNQTAIDMCVRNNMLRQLSTIEESLLGTSLDEIAGFLGDGNDDIENGLGLIGDETPNFLSSIVRNGTYSRWSNKELRVEILRFFASNYLGTDFDKIEKDEEYIKNELAKHGIKEIKIEEGFEDKDGKKSFFKKDSKNDNGMICFKVTYKIDTGMNFQSFFGIDVEPEFYEAIKIPLM